MESLFVQLSDLRIYNLRNVDTCVWFCGPVSHIIYFIKDSAKCMHVLYMLYHGICFYGAVKENQG